MTDDRRGRISSSAGLHPAHLRKPSILKVMCTDEPMHGSMNRLLDLLHLWISYCISILRTHQAACSYWKMQIFPALQKSRCTRRDSKGVAVNVRKPRTRARKGRKPHGTYLATTRSTVRRSSCDSAFKHAVIPSSIACVPTRRRILRKSEYHRFFHTMSKLYYLTQATYGRKDG